jgi:hypothetical protein
MAAQVVILRLNQQQLELIDNTVATAKRPIARAWCAGRCVSTPKSSIRNPPLPDRPRSPPCG